MSNLGSWEVASGSSGVVCIHTFYTPLNRLICIERPHEAPFPANVNTGGNPASEVQLTTNDAGNLNAQWTSLPITSNAFCGGHAQLGDGSILFVGGDARNDTGLQDGRRSVRLFTPCNSTACSQGTFTELYQMTSERWYPTVVTLEDGSAMIISGTKDNLDFSQLGRDIQNPTYEYYPQKTDGVWPRKLDILEWAFPFVLYPMAFQLPGGNVFLFVSNRSIILNPKTDEIYNTIADMVQPTHQPFIYPYSPYMLMLPLTLKNKYTATLLLCGGSERDAAGATVSSKQCFKINPEDQPRANWEKEDDMPVERVMLDGLILPDGKILFVNGAKWGLAGGSQGGDTSVAGSPVFETTLYDPEAPSGSRWTALPNSQIARLYHSGVILTTEGYVVTTGSEMQNYADAGADCFPKGLKNVCTSPYEYRLEKYTPYYLTTGKPRPQLISAPSETTYKSTVLIEIQPGTSIDRVTLIRYSTTTHQTNTDQRFIELEIVGTADGKVGIRMPSNGALAPPGNWMLFVLKDGVPSVAKTVLLRAGEVQNIPEDELKTLKKPSANGAADKSLGYAWMIVLSLVLFFQ